MIQLNITGIIRVYSHISLLQQISISLKHATRQNGKAMAEKLAIITTTGFSLQKQESGKINDIYLRFSLLY